MPTIDVNGARLDYVEHGQGESVVLVHGSLTDHRAWGAQIEAFMPRYRVVAYSRRYHYPNEWTGDGSDYSAVLHATDLAALVKQLGLAPAHVVASSYGAYIALVFAAWHPDLVRTLVLGEPPLLPWLDNLPDGEPLRQAFVSQAWIPARQALEAGEAENGVRLFIDGVLGAGAFDQLPGPARAMMLDNARALQAETAAARYFAPISCDDARAITVPTLLLNGENSPRMFDLITTELERCLPNRERATILAASHAMHLGNPAAYNEAVLKFLDQHRASA